MSITGSQPKVAVLVHTCDRYQFLYRGFAYAFNSNWDFSIPCSLYFATETLNVPVDNFTVIQSGKGEWADRLAYLLREVIKEDYVLYLQEDMWLNKPVNGAFFKQLFSLAAANGWQQVKLTSTDAYVTQPTKYVIEGFMISRLDNEKSKYLMSHQATFWKKDFLLQQMYKGEHPWRNERKGTKRLKKLNPAIYQIDYFAENGHPSINSNPAPVDRSEYQTVSMNSMLTPNVLPYAERLQQGSPEQQAYAAEILHHQQQQLTHDGLPKPHKQDVVKQFKNWLKKALKK